MVGKEKVQEEAEAQCMCYILSSALWSPFQIEVCVNSALREFFNRMVLMLVSSLAPCKNTGRKGLIQKIYLGAVSEVSAHDWSYSCCARGEAAVTAAIHFKGHCSHCMDGK